MSRLRAMPYGAINTLARGKLRRTALNRVDAVIERYTYHLCYPVSFDLDRMKEAVKGPFYTLPHGLSREELRAWLLSDNKDQWIRADDHEQ